MKVGGEYYRTYDPVWHCTWCQGVYDATGGAPPANLEQIFPVWNDVSSWNLNALNGVIRSVHDRHRRLLGEADREPRGRVAAG